MVPLLLFVRGRPARLRRRPGVSELYASVLMIGVTLSMGGLVSYSALSQFGLSSGSASLGSSLQQSSAEVQLGLSYASVVSSASCPVYAGHNEGTSLTVALYDYGTSSFTPAEFIVNSTIYQGSYSQLQPGTLGTYTLSLSSCAHASGLTLLTASALGDEVQFGT